MGRTAWTFTDPVVVTASGTLAFGQPPGPQADRMERGSPAMGLPRMGCFRERNSGNDQIVARRPKA